MWTCSVCNRTFQKANQPHSCRSFLVENHFKNKELAQKLFDCLVARINAGIGSCRTVSLPCCIHLFGTYDFLAVLPKKDRIEIRFALDRMLESPRITARVPLSATSWKHCLDITSPEQIDTQLLGWLSQSYFLKSL